MQYSCTGTLPVMTDVGDTVTCTGEMTSSSRYGNQLKCVSITPAPPDANTTEGLIRLFMRVQGVGKIKAKKYIEWCRTEGFDPVQHGIDHPESIPCRKGEEDNTSKLLIDLTQLFEHLVYLLGIGLTDNEADKILREFGIESTEIVSHNPYQIMDVIPGIGFMKADKIAFKAGISAGNMARVMACVQHCLNDSQANNGNTKIKGWSFTALVLDKLTESCRNNGSSVVGMPGKEDIRDAVYKLQNDGKVVVRDGWVYSKELLDAEKIIFENLTKQRGNHDEQFTSNTAV